MPAYSKAEILRSSREREKKMKNIRHLLGGLIVVVMVGGFLFLLNLNFFRLTAFSFSGQTSQDLIKLKQTVRKELNGYCLGLVPNNNIFFFSKTRLADLLKQKFPGLQSVKIGSPNLNTLAITVTDRESKVLWCNELVGGKRCYYLNDDGVVYQAAPNFSDAIILEFQSRTPVTKLNSAVINSRDLDQAKTFLNFLKSALTDWPPSTNSGQAIANSTYKLAWVNVLPLKDFEAIIVSVDKPNKAWKLLFNVSAPAERLITNLHSLIKDPTLTKDWSVNKELDYLDLRFDNKVFYKFK